MNDQQDGGRETDDAAGPWPLPVRAGGLAQPAMLSAVVAAADAVPPPSPLAFTQCKAARKLRTARRSSWKTSSSSPSCPPAPGGFPQAPLALPGRSSAQQVMVLARMPAWRC